MVPSPRVEATHAEVRAVRARVDRSRSESHGEVEDGDVCENTRRPPGRSRRATSGTERTGSQNDIAPWSQKTTSNDAVRERHRLAARADERDADARVAVDERRAWRSCTT